MRADLVGRTFGRYQIVQKVARGGMGVVYKAYEPGLNRFVALKLLPPDLSDDPQFVERFRREARAAAGLRHPNIVVIYAEGMQDGCYYIAMEYLPGRTLKEVIEQEGPLPLDRTVRLVRQIASALDLAHGQGIIHRDVKPANIFVGPDDHVTLVDFGIVRAAWETGLTRTGSVVGTPEYMSPEQARGQAIDHRTDIYALGIVVYEMLSGRVPFRADTPYGVLHMHIYDPPPPLRSLRPDLPAGAEGVLGKALAKDPGARYASAGAMADDLEQAMPVALRLIDDGLARTVVRPEPIPSPRRRLRPVLVGVAALLGLAALVALGVMSAGRGAVEGGATRLILAANTSMSALPLPTKTEPPPTTDPTPSPTPPPPTATLRPIPTPVAFESAEPTCPPGPFELCVEPSTGTLDTVFTVTVWGWDRDRDDSYQLSVRDAAGTDGSEPKAVQPFDRYSCRGRTALGWRTGFKSDGQDPLGVWTVIIQALPSGRCATAEVVVMP